jgi:hypothetical protein
MTDLVMFSRRRSSCEIPVDSWLTALLTRLIRVSRLAKSPLFGKLVERNSANNDKGSWTMLSPDLWLRQQLWQRLWKGPAAVSAYLSLPIQLVCTALSAIVSTDLAIPSLYILSINVLLCVLIILVDQIGSYRNHRLGLLRFSAAKSQSRIEALGIKSKQVDRFVSALWLNSELEFRFRNTRMQSVELIIEALDLLSRTASRYGRRGRKVFVVNQEPIMSAMRLIACLPLADAEEVLVEPLKTWLEHPPEFDPEGWALPLFGEF